MKAEDWGKVNHRGSREFVRRVSRICHIGGAAVFRRKALRVFASGMALALLFFYGAKEVMHNPQPLLAWVEQHAGVRLNLPTEAPATAKAPTTSVALSARS